MYIKYIGRGELNCGSHLYAEMLPTSSVSNSQQYTSPIPSQIIVFPAVSILQLSGTDSVPCCASWTILLVVSCSNSPQNPNIIPFANTSSNTPAAQNPSLSFILLTHEMHTTVLTTTIHRKNDQKQLPQITSFACSQFSLTFISCSTIALCFLNEIENKED